MAKKVTQKPGLQAPSKLKILVTIVNRNKANFYLDILEGFDVNLQTVVYGRGTSPFAVEQLLGLENQNKAVLLSFIDESRVKEVLNAYEDKYFKTKNGSGVAFTIPVSSMIGVMLYQFLSHKGEQQ